MFIASLRNVTRAPWERNVSLRRKGSIDRT